MNRSNNKNNRNMIQQQKSQEDNFSNIFENYSNSNNKQRNQNNSNDKITNANHSNVNKNTSKVMSQVSCSTLTNCLFSFIKKVKSSPLQLIQYLEKRSDKYDRKNPFKYYPFDNDTNFSVITKEGKKGVQQLVDYLDKQAVRNCQRIDIKWSEQLHRAATKRAEAIQNGNITIQEMDIGQLVSEYAMWRISLSEIIVYGFIDPKQIIIQGLLQDGLDQKSNRISFFNSSAKYVGIGMANHPVYKIVVVIILAGGYKSAKQQTYKEIRDDENKCQIY